MKLQELAVSLVVRSLPDSVRSRYRDELSAELTNSSRPGRDALSLLLHLPQLRAAVVAGLEPVPWRCRVGRHDFHKVMVDSENPDAFFLRCSRCPKERNPGDGITETKEQQAAWMAGGGTQMIGGNRGAGMGGL